MREGRRQQGLSPPVRGSLAERLHAYGHAGGLSPPVRGSHPGEELRRPSARRVYPRPCGGAVATIRQIVARIPGSIPARAGEPLGMPCYTAPCKGLSPPVRGNLRRAIPSPGPDRSIPARAGEPPGARACPYLRGLSPPVRGNHLPSGLISARGKVYPRPCGGTVPGQLAESTPVRGSQLADSTAGLSPPVRGSPVAPRSRFRLRRSIPARAGEPSVVMIGLGPTGLSPPVRGSRRVPEGKLIRVYPRPCGGARGHRGVRSTVYPRPCGGATEPGTQAGSAGTDAGLSPPVRGNLLAMPPWKRRGVAVYPRPCGGARMRRVGRRALPTRVYPRPCGGAPAETGRLALPLMGLSPPVRGKPCPHGSLRLMR